MLDTIGLTILAGFWLVTDILTPSDEELVLPLIIVLGIYWLLVGICLAQIVKEKSKSRLLRLVVFLFGFAIVPIGFIALLALAAFFGFKSTFWDQWNQEAEVE